MAIGIKQATTTLSEHSSKQATCRTFRKIKPLLYRLSTFRTWKNNNDSFVSPAVLCRAGFSYTGRGDRVKCDTCGLEIECWTRQMDPIEEHIQRSPQCPLVQSETDVFVKKEKPNALSLITPSHLDQPTPAESNVILLSEPRRLRQETLFIDILSKEAVERARHYTFSNWPMITPSPMQMAQAGWWYTNIADRVICVHCDTMFHNWTDRDSPYTVHRLKSPNCYFIRSDETHHEGQGRETPIANGNLLGLSAGQVVPGAIHADLALVSRRRTTFEKLHETQKTNLPPIDSFVDAGFFYTGEDAIVRCFYCNGALKRWNKNDDPKIEHARWFPHCAYIRQYIGENLYQAIQRKNRELRAQQSLQESRGAGTTITNSTKYTPWSEEEIDRMVKARLDLPIVEKFRQENISMAIIRKVLDMQLRFKKDDFKTDLDFRIACLILEKQVKLINGNESNILVPQNWMKNYLEEEANQKKSDNVRSPTTIVPLPKTAAPSGATAKNDESNLCLLCLSTERQIACLPCGHLTSCVSCGHSLKTCPICRAAVKAFVRVYI